MNRYNWFSLNSTMVRLKPINNGKIFVIRIKSQFHYGSIKTGAKMRYQWFNNRSQFHYGSIKTRISPNA